MLAIYTFTEKEREVINKLLEATFNMIPLREISLETYKKEVEELERHGIIRIIITDHHSHTYTFGHYSMVERLRNAITLM